jgi:hypothetical protein
VGSNLAEGDALLMVIKVCSMPAFRQEVKLQPYVIRFYREFKIPV